MFLIRLMIAGSLMVSSLPWDELRDQHHGWHASRDAIGFVIDSRCATRLVVAGLRCRESRSNIRRWCEYRRDQDLLRNRLVKARMAGQLTVFSGRIE
jgi:hypothetical protein